MGFFDKLFGGKAEQEETAKFFGQRKTVLTLQADLSTSGTHITIVGIGHLAGTIHDTAHDTDLQAF